MKERGNLSDYHAFISTSGKKGSYGGGTGCSTWVGIVLAILGLLDVIGRLMD